MSEEWKKHEHMNAARIDAKCILLAIAILSFLTGCSAQARGANIAAPEGLEAAPQPVVAQPEPTSTAAVLPSPQRAEPPVPTPNVTVVPTVSALPIPAFTNPSLASFEETAARWNAEFWTIDMTNTGLWEYVDRGTLVHPISLAYGDGVIYLIDSGRVLEVDLHLPGVPHILLEPGDEVARVPVLEPLDLSFAGDQLLVLDRAGDVYAYDPISMIWRLDRYDRPVEASSGHYFVALSSDPLFNESMPRKALLETNYKFVELYDEEQNRIWRLPEQRAIDLAYDNGDVFVLQRELHDQEGHATKYRETSSISTFAPQTAIEQPRQLSAAPEGLFVLDQGGRRLLLFEREYGQLIRVIQLPHDSPISAFTADLESGKLLLASTDRLYFVGDPDRSQSLHGFTETTALQSHDPDVLSRLDNFVVPIGGSNITYRDFQLPGAPRHYRLGIHRGIDYYWQPGTEVLAVGDGIVLRADEDYVDATAVELSAWAEDSRQRGDTSPEILDNYMGRQVWIEHEPGVVSRYAHLRSIEPGLEPGVRVARGQTIGEVGNSGSPASLESDYADAHLHYELWLDNSYLGQYLRPIETRDWVEQIFPVMR